MRIFKAVGKWAGIPKIDLQNFVTCIGLDGREGQFQAVKKVFGEGSVALMDYFHAVDRLQKKVKLQGRKRVPPNELDKWTREWTARLHAYFRFTRLAFNPALVSALWARIFQDPGMTPELAFWIYTWVLYVGQDVEGTMRGRQTSDLEEQERPKMPVPMVFPSISCALSRCRLASGSGSAGMESWQLEYLIRHSEEEEKEATVRLKGLRTYVKTRLQPSLAKILRCRRHRAGFSGHTLVHLRAIEEQSVFVCDRNGLPWVASKSDDPSTVEIAGNLVAPPQKFYIMSFLERSEMAGGGAKVDAAFRTEDGEADHFLEEFDTNADPGEDAECDPELEKSADSHADPAFIEESTEGEARRQHEMTRLEEVAPKIMHLLFEGDPEELAEEAASDGAWHLLNQYAVVADWRAAVDVYIGPHDKSRGEVCFHCKDYANHSTCRHLSRRRCFLEPASFKSLWKAGKRGRKTEKQWTARRALQKSNKKIKVSPTKKTSQDAIKGSSAMKKKAKSAMKVKKARSPLKAKKAQSPMKSSSRKK